MLDIASDCLVSFSFIVEATPLSITKFSPVFEVLLSVFGLLYDSLCIKTLFEDSSSVDTSSELTYSCF